MVFLINPNQSIWPWVDLLEYICLYAIMQKENCLRDIIMEYLNTRLGSY